MYLVRCTRTCMHMYHTLNACVGTSDGGWGGGGGEVHLLSCRMSISRRILLMSGRGEGEKGQEKGRVRR